jgi:nicotinate-nucleotide--dimethylbenzimidazole phosphoribosyltransferase
MNEHSHSDEQRAPGQDATSVLDDIRAAAGPLDSAAMAAARERLDRMTKPPGSLGALEEVAVRLAGLAGCCPPPMPEPAAVAIFAADHGVHAQRVTPWPQEVTAQMVANFLAGGAVVNAFAAQAGAEVVVVDVGVRAELDHVPGLLPRKIAPGTADFTAGPAMTREQAEAAIAVGTEVARDLVTAGNRCLLTGDMGIANTTASAALVCAFTGRDAAEVTGRGTGIDDETLARKVDVVSRGLARHQPDPADPVGVLAAFGGFEHAALAGFILGGAALRTPVILDGMIAGAAALAAAALAPRSADCCLAGHLSAEPGHAAALDHLGLKPLIDLGLRLGEGTGALLALPVAASAVRALREVATFDSAGVTDKG